MSKEYEITIKVRYEDFVINPPGPLNGKCYKAYKEAKEKEIKVGDWVYSMETQRMFNASHTGFAPSVIKLPQKLQEGLNKFIEDQSNG